jgi:endonuclease-3
MTRKPSSPTGRTRAAAAPSTPPGVAARDVRRAHELLERRFGPLDPPRRLDPLEELILTVLSQNTSDMNRDRAYASLTARFATWEEVADADVRDVADAIRPGGLANTKAPRIQAILRAIERDHGKLDLRFLDRLPDDEVRTYLMALPGVGPKTAACVMAFSLLRPALPVDTHVGRAAERLGWIPPRANGAVAHAALERVVPPDLRVSMHVGLIRLGREICKPGRPRCEDCPLHALCPTAPLVLSGAWRGDRARSGAAPRRRTRSR